MENEQRKSVRDIFKPSREECEVPQQSHESLAAPEGAGAHLGGSVLFAAGPPSLSFVTAVQQPCDRGSSPCSQLQ